MQGNFTMFQRSREEKNRHNLLTCMELKKVMNMQAIFVNVLESPAIAICQHGCTIMTLEEKAYGIYLQVI